MLSGSMVSFRSVVLVDEYFVGLVGLSLFIQILQVGDLFLKILSLLLTFIIESTSLHYAFKMTFVLEKPVETERMLIRKEKITHYLWWLNLQICHVFKFNKSLSILAATLKFTARELPSFGLTMAVIFMAFASWTYCTYSSLLHDYR